MKCLICGRRSLPGAKLCADCRAARKRAFAATVTQPLLLAAAGSKGAQRLLRPSQSVAATVRRAAEQSLFVKPPPSPEPAIARLRRADFVLLVAALGAMAVSGVYAAHRLHAPPNHDPSVPVAQSDGADRQAAATGMSVAPTPTALKPAAADSNASSVPDVPPDASTKTESAKRPVARQRITVAPAAPMPPLGRLAAISPVAPRVEAAAPPPPNPLQAINDGLTRCANSDFVDRPACELRVRQQYCSGYWGRVTQCPIGVVSDHGQ